jgi:tetratricopeptide (TPR) repeat protein
MLLASTGRLNEALERMDRGLQTTPYQATWHAIRASVLYFLRRYPEAVAAADRAISLDRTNTAAWDWRSKALYQLGRGEDAVRAMADFPFANRSADLDRACRERGAKGGLEQLLAITDDGQSRLHQCWRRATWFAFLGDSDRALDELEKSLELRNPNLAWVAVDPAYESLRGHPRFRSILERMKLRG